MINVLKEKFSVPFWSINDVTLSDSEVADIRNEYNNPNGYDADLAVENQITMVNNWYFGFSVPQYDDDFMEFVKEFVHTGRTVQFVRSEVSEDEFDEDEFPVVEDVEFCNVFFKENGDIVIK